MQISLTILKLHARHAGIYAVLCAPATLCYVGQSRRTIAARWDEHINLLTLGRHPNDAMQAAWKAHGSKAFSVAILEVVIDPKRLDERESWWIQKIGSANRKGR